MNNCHKCKHAREVELGVYADIPWEKTPCAQCVSIGTQTPRPSHAVFYSFNDKIVPPQEPPPCGDPVQPEESELRERVAMAVYSIASLNVAEVVAIWNHMRGGKLEDAGKWLGVSKQRVQACLFSGLRKLGVEDVWQRTGAGRVAFLRRNNGAAKVGWRAKPRGGVDSFGGCS